MYAFDVSHGTKDGVECANTQRVVVRNRQPVMTRGIRFQNHVAAFLIDPAVAVMFAEQLDQLCVPQSGTISCAGQKFIPHQMQPHGGGFGLVKEIG